MPLKGKDKQEIKKKKKLKREVEEEEEEEIEINKINMKGEKQTMLPLFCYGVRSRREERCCAVKLL